MERSPQPGSHSCKLVRSQLEAEGVLSALATTTPLITLREALRDGSLFLVGGTVRDAFLDATGTDLDVATNLLADEVRMRCESYGLRVVETGIQHGTVLVLVNDVHIEVTTFRVPSHREIHQCARDIRTDLSGRDFTINALAFDIHQSAIIDPFGGIGDLQASIVRAVEDPKARLSEDPLRILRMIRFGDAQGRSIEPNTLQAAMDLVSLLEKISVERIRNEVEQIIMSPAPHSGLRRVMQIGALPFTIPELIPAVGFEQNRYHIHDVFEHTLAVLERTPCDKILRWAAIFHDVGKPHTLSVDPDGERHFYSHEVVSNTLCRERMKHLRFSHDDIEQVSAIVRHHMRPLECGPAGVRRIIRDLGDNLPRWRAFKEADSSPTIPMSEFARAAQSFDDLLATEQSKMAGPSYGRLAISGNDLISLGMKPGPAMGYILRELEELVIENPAKNQKKTLLAIAKRRMKR